MHVLQQGEGKDAKRFAVHIPRFQGRNQQLEISVSCDCVSSEHKALALNDVSPRTQG